MCDRGPIGDYLQSTAIQRFQDVHLKQLLRSVRPHLRASMVDGLLQQIPTFLNTCGMSLGQVLKLLVHISRRIRDEIDGIRTVAHRIRVRLYLISSPLPYDTDSIFFRMLTDPSHPSTQHPPDAMFRVPSGCDTLPKELVVLENVALSLRMYLEGVIVRIEEIRVRRTFSAMYNDRLRADHTVRSALPAELREMIFQWLLLDEAAHPCGVPRIESELYTWFVEEQPDWRVDVSVQQLIGKWAFWEMNELIKRNRQRDYLPDLVRL